MKLTRQHEFWKSVAVTVTVLLGLIAFAQAPFGRGRGQLIGAERLRQTVRLRGPSVEDRENQTAGYYQELLNGASAVVVETPAQFNQFVGGRQIQDGVARLEELDANVAPVNDYAGDFLVYRPRPNLDLPDPRFNNVRQQTNSFGYSDGEYPLHAAPGTWRVVVLGDSMARALGVAPGGGFEPKLESFLNDQATGGAIGRFEFINMGVSGYRLTQIVDLARTDTPRFEPNAYVLVVSWLTVARKWGLHLAQLVEDGVDLKYDFLRGVARDAKLRRGDSAAVSEAKLAPFMLPAFRWAIGEIAALAKARGAPFAVILIPHLKGIGSYEGDFGPVRKVLADADVPVADLLDAFDDADIGALDVGDGLHPNAAGHDILLERLKIRIDGDPRLAAAFRGAPPPAVATR